MSSELVDRTAPANDPRTPKPRGLLPVPREVETVVAREEALIAQQHGIRITAEARKRLTDDFTLQHYYEGTDVADRETPQGVEILAVGGDEIGDYLKTIPPERRQDVRIRQP
jgi:hypothetical protein